MLIAYVPVLHKGYVDLFRKHSDHTLGILGDDIIAEFTSLTRDVRSVSPLEMKSAIESLGIFPSVEILSLASFAQLAQGVTADCPSSAIAQLILPDEDISHNLANRFFKDSPITFESVFLRWNRMPTLAERIPNPNQRVSQDACDKAFINLAQTESQKSSDWWRQVGSVCVKDGSIILQSHNRHLPTDAHLAHNGDPRTIFNAGESIDISTAIHSEASLIAEAANKGISLKGSSLYVTVFPCSNCARLIALSGITIVFFHEGYSRLDGEEILRSFGVEIILVE